MSSIKESKVTLKGQIVIPKELREELDIKPGEKLLIKKIDRKVLLIPKPKEPIDFLIEIAKKVKLGNLRKEIKEFRKEVEE
jgi:AbrB family transcriptional regulator (stage V sporulation protein T)